ncbi:hypothetical protein ACEZ3G_02540 [Maribacter algicola]|uniref:Uncharacterized protein n=1 Tax=Meishania litoralis TaxID=3434685 RepID=A0ACC7LH82_9FLAO
MLFIALVFGSCKALLPSPLEKGAFKTLDSTIYPFQEITNEDVSKSFSELLEVKEIQLLEDFKRSTSMLANFFKAECPGCSNKTTNLKPLYKVEKGKFLHFGLQSEMGVENWVFKKNGRFVTRFYMFQGDAPEQIEEQLKDLKNLDRVVEGVYPTAINSGNVYLEYAEYSNTTDFDNQWYKPSFPTKLGYTIDLKKSSDVRFSFKGGLYSFQETNNEEAYQIINFVEPMFYGNAAAIDGPQTYSSVTDAFYANATFFLFDLREDAQVSVHIESETEEGQYKFSILKNERFYTLKEYLSKKGELFGSYKALLDKGSYLIRVLHENANFAEMPLYTVYIAKNALDLLKPMQPF